jgi:hypothetical protein
MPEQEPGIVPLDRAELRPAGWAPADGLPIELCNQMALQGVQDVIVMTLGRAVPPILRASTPDEAREEVEKLGGVQVQPLARFAIPLATLRQMASSFQTLLAQLDAQIAQQQQSQPGAPTE